VKVRAVRAAPQAQVRPGGAGTSAVRVGKIPDT
jgi:hypothetical protein